VRHATPIRNEPLRFDNATPKSCSKSLNFTASTPSNADAVDAATRVMPASDKKQNINIVEYPQRPEI